MIVYYAHLYNKKRQDPMFYYGEEYPIAIYKHKGLTWEMWCYGITEITYKEEKFFNAAEFCKSDHMLDKLIDSEKAVVHYNSWFELRPSDRPSDISYYEHGMYDEVYYSPEEITDEILDEYIRLEMDIKDQLISK